MPTLALRISGTSGPLSHLQKHSILNTVLPISTRRLGCYRHYHSSPAFFIREMVESKGGRKQATLGYVRSPQLTIGCVVVWIVGVDTVFSD